MTTVLTEAQSTNLAGARSAGEDLWLTTDDLTRATGWVLKAEGLCQGEVCVPADSDWVTDEGVNVAAFWRHLGRPALHDNAGETWMLGSAAADRAAALSSLAAPDFELPDLNGTLHRLSDYRGKRVFLTTWSSW